MRLEGFQDMLAVLFGNGCRRDALLGATLGPELASQCPACDSCDRCCIIVSNLMHKTFGIKLPLHRVAHQV